MGSVSLLFQHLMNGLTLGGIYALIALGYTMVYGILKFINFAHGDIIMVCALIQPNIKHLLRMRCGCHFISLFILRKYLIIPCCNLISSCTPCSKIYTDITIRIALINQRIEQLISCADENIRKAAENYISDVKSGKISVCADNALIDALKVSPYANTENGRLTSLIEMKQYLKGSWDNEIGLSANYNMKREAISANESERDNDILLPFIDEMHKSWTAGFDEVNAKYGTSIKVELTGTWDEKVKENGQQENEKTEEGGQQENEIE